MSNRENNENIDLQAMIKEMAEKGIEIELRTSKDGQVKIFEVKRRLVGTL